ncbi:MAG: phosphoribosylglycinamide formyltransferase [Paracoccaceae bacterium]
MKRVALLISGGGSNMETLARDMVGDHAARPVLVISNVADAGGLAKAAALGIPTAVVDHKPYKGDRAAFEAALQKVLESARPDIICLAGFMRILTADFVARWEGKILNIHPSLLPKYKGLNTHARAIEAGDAEAGCSVHLVTATLDDGPVLGQSRVPVLIDDSPETLAERVLEQEHVLYPLVLRRFATGEATQVRLPAP